MVPMGSTAVRVETPLGIPGAGAVMVAVVVTEAMAGQSHYLQLGTRLPPRSIQLPMVERLTPIVVAPADLAAPELPTGLRAQPAQMAWRDRMAQSMKSLTHLRKPLGMTEHSGNGRSAEFPFIELL